MVLDELVVRQRRHPQLHTHLEEGVRNESIISRVFHTYLKSRKNLIIMCVRMALPSWKNSAFRLSGGLACFTRQ